MQFAGRALAVTLGLLTLAMMTRALGDFGFGEFTTAVTYLQILTVLVDFGLTLMFIQLLGKPDADEARIGSALLGLRLASAAIFLGIGALLALLTPYSLTIKLAILAGTISYLALTSSGMLVGLFQKHLAINRVVIAELVNRTIVLVLVALFAMKGAGVIAMVVAVGVGNLIQLFITFLFAQQFALVRPSVDLPLWISTLKQSWPIGLSTFFNLIYLKSDIMILGLYFPQSDVGVYGAAYRVIDVFTALPVMYVGLVLPHLTLAWARKERQTFTSYLQTTFDFFAMLSIPILVGSALVGAPLMEWIAGPEFTLSGHVLPVLMLTMPAIFFGALTGHAIIALEKQRQILWAYVLTAVVSLVGYFLLIPLFGIWGAAWMTVLSEYLINLITALVVFRTARYCPRVLVLGKAILGSVIMALVLSVLPDWHVLILVAVGITVYGASLMVVGAVTPTQVRRLLLQKSV
ncbi:MAG: Polysaccharide biosynthesis protein [Parcubacteria group bacterium GW2011_GWA2_56_7]|nr:MAG: Polysaccharide biosynthesis protein [Parcubacteria group bacterium GW2011_GWA2_56_7]